MFRLTLVLAVASVVLGVGIAAAEPPSPDNAAGPGNDILGVVPTQAAAHSEAGKGGSGGNLVYHGGKVLHTNRTVAIYWVPSGSTFASGYDSQINQYFGDVAAASGNRTTSTGSRRSTTTAPVLTSRTSRRSAARVTDSNAYPTSGMQRQRRGHDDLRQRRAVPRRDPGLSTTGKFGRRCEHDVLRLHGEERRQLLREPSCAFSQYCAYHSNVSVGGTTVQYANQPYTDTVPAAAMRGITPTASRPRPTRRSTSSVTSIASRSTTRSGTPGTTGAATRARTSARGTSERSRATTTRRSTGTTTPCSRSGATPPPAARCTRKRSSGA